MAARKKVVVQTRRDYDGKVYSQVRDLIEYEKRYDHKGSDYTPHTVVIDRAKGRHMDQDTVLNRAQSLAQVMGCQYDEDLFWPCKAEEGWGDCNCPRCAKKVDERSKK